MQYISYYKSPLGSIVMASDGEFLTGLWFEGQKYSELYLDEEHEVKNLSVLSDTKRWLDVYFSGKNPGFTVQIRLLGSAFQTEVWEILRGIPYGETATYGEIADMIAKIRGVKKMSARAVGGAIGKNRISIIVPCHRVIGSDGSITGYAGGIERKAKLLHLEGAVTLPRKFSLNPKSRIK